MHRTLRIHEPCRPLMHVLLLGAIFLACRHEQRLESEPPRVADCVVDGLDVFVGRGNGAFRRADQEHRYQWGRLHGSWAGFGKARVALLAHEDKGVFVASLGAMDLWAEHGALLLKLRVANNRLQIEDAAWHGSFDFDPLSWPAAEVDEGWIHYDDGPPLNSPISLRAFFRGDMPNPIASRWMYSVSIPRI